MRENECGPDGEILDPVWSKSIGELLYPLNSGAEL